MRLGIASLLTALPASTDIVLVLLGWLILGLALLPRALVSSLWATE